MRPSDRTFNGNWFVEVDGITYYRWWNFERKGSFRFTVQLVSKASPYLQGLAFSFSEAPGSKFRGNLFINEKRFDPSEYKQSLYVFPFVKNLGGKLVLDLEIQDGSFSISTASDLLGDIPPEVMKRLEQQTGMTQDRFRGNAFCSGFTASAQLKGNAFWIEKLDKDCYRFHCNDHVMDEDFDDLVFDLSIEERKTGDGSLDNLKKGTQRDGSSS